MAQEPDQAVEMIAGRSPPGARGAGRRPRSGHERRAGRAGAGRAPSRDRRPASARPAGRRTGPAVHRPRSQLGADRGRIDRGRLLVRDPRVDHRQPVVGHAEPSIEVDHRVRVADQAVAPGRQPTVHEPSNLPSTDPRPSPPRPPPAPSPAVTRPAHKCWPRRSRSGPRRTT